MPRQTRATGGDTGDADDSDGSGEDESDESEAKGEGESDDSDMRVATRMCGAVSGLKKVCMTGAGSARPVVSMRT